MQTDHNAGPTISTHLQQPLPLSNQDQTMLQTDSQRVTNYFDEEKKFVHSHNSLQTTTGQEELLLFGYSDQISKDQQIDESLAQQEQTEILQSEHDINLIKKDLVQQNNNLNLKKNNLSKNNCDENKQFTDSFNLSKSDQIFFISMNEPEVTQSILEQKEQRDETENNEILDLPEKLNNPDEEDKLEIVQSTEQEPNSQVSEERTGSTIKSESNLSSPEMDPLFGNADRSSGSQEALQEQNNNARMPSVPFTLDDQLVNIFEEHEPQKQSIARDQVKKDYSTLSNCLKALLSSQFIQNLITVQRNFSELENILLDMADQLLLNEIKKCSSFFKPDYDATNFINNDEHLNIEILEFTLFEGFSIQQLLLAINELPDFVQLTEILKEVLNSYQVWSHEGQQSSQNNTIFQKKVQEFLFHIDEKSLTFQQFSRKIISQEPEIIENDELMSPNNFELEQDQDENEKQKMQWNETLNHSIGRTELNFDEDEEFEKDLNIDNFDQDSEGGKKEEPEEEDEEGVIIDEENKRDDYNKPKDHLQQVELSRNDWQPLERFRAKLYTLGNFGKWSDRGTGHFMIDQIEPGQYKMILLKEDTGEDLLIDEYIKPNIIFDKQRETIITWADKETAKDLAVSFQAAQGAAFSWLKICQIQGRDPELNQAEPAEIDEEQEDNQLFSLEQLPNLAQDFKLNNVFDPEQKQDLIDSLISNDGQNLVRLGELFEECEREVNNWEKPASEYLLCFFFIYKGLIQFNDQHLLEILLSDRFYLDTFGALEWDPDGLDEVEESQITEESQQKQVTNNQDCNIKYEEEEEDEEEDTNLKRDQYIKETKNPIECHEGQENLGVKDEQGLEDQKEDNKLVYYHFRTLNYRVFLERSVKFKKLIDFKDPFKKQEESNKTEVGRLNIQASFDIEERIHMNYRLQFLRDTVMARYIDELVQKSINQLIASNNREIVGSIFGLPNFSQNSNYNSNEYNQNNEYQGFIFSQNNYQRGSQPNGAQQIPERGVQTIKDLVLQKIRSKTEIKEKYMAIEFMIELCQILKSLQFQPGMMGGTNSFLYGNNNNNNMAFNNRQIIEQLNQAAVIGALAETMNILVPDYEILQIKIKDGQQKFLLSQGEDSSEDYHEKYINLLRQKNPQITEQKVLEDLLEFQQDHNNQTNFEAKGKKSMQQSSEYNSWERISRLDQMKINSLEILISFYQSPNLPSLDINKFIFGQDQHQPHTSRGMQFLNNMLSHLFFSSEQGIKLQVADFFKSLLEPDGTSIQHKRQIYEVVLKRLVDFLKFLTSSDNFDAEIAQLKKQREQQMNEEYFEDNDQQWPTHINLFKNMEYSAQLVMQLISRCVAEHRYPFKDFFLRYQIVGVPTKLRKFNSKLLDIEIVKFYKSLFRAKDPSYIQMISQKNLFVETILDLFKETYRKRNPPLIQSCLRDLFDSIFKQNLGGKQQISANDLFSPSFVQYLTKFNSAAQNIIFDDQYSCVFGRYNLTKTYTTNNQQQGNNRFNNQSSSNLNQPQQEQEFIQYEINSINQNKQISNQVQQESINDNNSQEKEDKCQKQQSSPISSQSSIELEVLQSIEESKSEPQLPSQSGLTQLNQLSQGMIQYSGKKFRSKLGIDEGEVIRVSKFYNSNQSEKNIQEISKQKESSISYDFQINLNQDLTPQHSEPLPQQNKCEVITSIDLERESENENSSESSLYSEEDQEDGKRRNLSEQQIAEQEQQHLGKRRSNDNQQGIQKRQKTEQ